MAAAANDQQVDTEVRGQRQNVPYRMSRNDVVLDFDALLLGRGARVAGLYGNDVRRFRSPP